MTQNYEYDIKREIQNLILNYQNRVIRVSTDYNIITIGNLQIEPLNWKRNIRLRDNLRNFLMFSPWSGFAFIPGCDICVPTKYGLSCRTEPLTLKSYKPLYEFGELPENVKFTMGKEADRMRKEGAKECKNGIEIVPESPVWNTVDTLANKSINTFRTLLGQKVQDLGTKHVSYDDEELLDVGVQVTPEIATILKTLSDQIIK